MKTTKTLIAIMTALFILGWTTACNKTAENKNTAVNQPVAANTNQSPANKPESNKSDPDMPSMGSLATPTDAYKSAYAARQKKDIEGLKKVLSKDALEFFTMMGKEDGKTLDDGLKELVETPQAATAETRNEKITGDKATLEYLNEKGSWLPMDFVKEGKDWKLTIVKPDPKELKGADDKKSEEKKTDDKKQQ
jgi:hypothetical protein